MGHEVFRLLATIKTNGKAAVAEFKAAEGAGKTAGARLGTAFKKLAKIMKVVFVVGAAAATYAMGKFFVSSIKSATQFEAGMANVKAVTQANGKEFEALGKKAKQLGKITKFGMTEISRGMEALGRAGMTANEIIDSMAGVAALAASQCIELGQAAEMTAGALNGFNLEADQAARVADVYAYAASNSAIRTEDLAETLKYAMPAANALGYSLEDVAGMAMILGDNMIKGSMAGTGLSFAFSELVGMSDEFQKKLGDVGVSVDDLTGPDGKLMSMAEILGVLKTKGLDAGDMFELFGKRAGKSMVILLDKGETAIKDYTGALEECGGTAEEMAEIQLNTLSGQLEILKGSWELLKVTVGEKLIPILKDFVKGTLIPLVNRMAEAAAGSDTLKTKFKAFIDKVKDGIEWIVEHRRGLVTALKAITAGFAALIAIKIATWIVGVIAGFTSLGTAIAAGSPVGLALVGIGALFLIAYQAGKVLPTVLGNIKAGFEEMGKEAGEAAVVLRSFNQRAEESRTAAEALAEEYEWFIKSLEYGQGPIGLTTKDLETLKGKVKEAYEALEGAPSPEAAMRQWSRLINEIIDTWSGAYPELQKLYQGVVQFGEGVSETGEKLDRMHAQGIRWAEGIIARSLAVATAQRRVADVGEETQKAIDRFEEMEEALYGSKKGTIEYADAVKDLQGLYNKLGEYQDFFVENNMEVDKSILDLIADIKALGVVVEKEVKTGWAAAWDHMKQSLKKFCEDVKSLLTSHLGETLIAWSNMRKENEAAAKEHAGTLEDIHEDYADKSIEIDENRVKRLREINEGEAESLEDLRDDYEENLGDIQDISDKMADLQGDRLKGLAKQQQSYVDKIVDLERGLQRSRLQDEERFQNAREDTTTDYNRAIEDENTRYGRDLADLEEDIAKASGDRLENLLDRKAELTEGHGERLADIELRKTRRLEDIQTDAARAEEARVQEEIWAREKIEEDHKTRLEGIEERYTERVTELYEERDAKLEKAEQDFQERRTKIVDDARKDREKIEADYNTALAEAHADEKARLDQEAVDYEDQRKTVWGILKQGVRDFLSALKEKLLLKAAAAAVEATALDIAAGIMLFFGNFVGAAKKAAESVAYWAEAGSYALGAVGLAVAGFKEGVVAMKPTLGVIGEGYVPEVAIPLTQEKLSSIGAGAVREYLGPQGQLAYAGEGGGGQTIEIHIEPGAIAEGATFYVREEADIERIAKELGDEFDDRIIGKGRVSP